MSQTATTLWEKINSKNIFQKRKKYNISDNLPQSGAHLVGFKWSCDSVESAQNYTAGTGQSYDNSWDQCYKEDNH